MNDFLDKNSGIKNVGWKLWDSKLMYKRIFDPYQLDEYCRSYEKIAKFKVMMARLRVLFTKFTLKLYIWQAGLNEKNSTVIAHVEQSKNCFVYFTFDGATALLCSSCCQCGAVFPVFLPHFRNSCHTRAH